MLKQQGHYKRGALIALLTILVTVLSGSFSGLSYADNAGLNGEDTQAVVFLKQPKDKTEPETPRKYLGENQSTIQPQVIQISKDLAVTAFGQETTYYCGPASAYQLLYYLGVRSNPVDGRPLTQANLATDLHTSSSTGTPFPGWWETTLETWSKRGWTTVWAPNNPNFTLSFFWNTTLDDIDNNRPLIYDCVMSPTSGYLPGYEGTTATIYHYVTGSGYWFEDTFTYFNVHYVDPNRYRSGAFGWHSVSRDLMYNVVRGRGMVY